MHTYSEERNSDDDAPVLGARQLVDGVADVAVVLLGGAAEAGAGGDDAAAAEAGVAGVNRRHQRASALAVELTDQGARAGIPHRWRSRFFLLTAGLPRISPINQSVAPYDQP